MSDRLADLEKRVGLKLFRRGPRGMRLTEAGEVFAESSQRILSEAEQLEMKLSPFAHAFERKLKIACNYNASVAFLPKRIGRFLSQHPDVQIDVRQMSSPEIVRQVSAGEADLGITAYTGSHPLLTFQPFATDRLVGLVHRNCQLACRKSISFSDLFPYNYIGVGPYSAMQEFLFERAAEEGKTIRPRVIASSLESVMSLVAEGAGVSVLPKEGVARNESVVALNLNEPWALRHLRLCRKTDRSTHSDEQNELIDAFVKIVLDACATPQDE